MEERERGEWADGMTGGQEGTVGLTAGQFLGGRTWRELACNGGGRKRGMGG